LVLYSDKMKKANLYQFTGNQEGEKVSGSLWGRTDSQVTNYLRDKGIKVITLRAKQTKSIDYIFIDKYIPQLNVGKMEN